MTYRGGNITFYNLSDWTANGSAASAFGYCHSPHFDSRILVLLLHAIVTAAGLSINLYMLQMLSRDLRGTSPGSRPGSPRGFAHFHHFLFHIGLCDICMLTTFPMWITQTVFARGWIFGYAGCKAVKGLMTFSLQYGILTMVYINVERFVRVVYNKTTFLCLKYNTSKRITVCLLCSSLPLISCLTDVYFYTTVELRDVTMCVNTANPHVQLVGLWIRTTICFIAPVVVLVLCNGAVMYAVKRHVRKVSSAGIIQRSLRGARIIPLLTVAVFICCWIPWIVSSVYYSFTRTLVRCPATVFTVINVSLAIGNVHCVMTPAMYLFMRTRRANPGRTSGVGTIKSSSLQK